MKELKPAPGFTGSLFLSCLSSFSPHYPTRHELHLHLLQDPEPSRPQLQSCLSFYISLLNLVQCCIYLTFVIAMSLKVSLGMSLLCVWSGKRFLWHRISQCYLDQNFPRPFYLQVHQALIPHTLKPYSTYHFPIKPLFPVFPLLINIIPSIHLLKSESSFILFLSPSVSASSRTTWSSARQPSIPLWSQLTKMHTLFYYSIAWKSSVSLRIRSRCLSTA